MLEWVIIKVNPDNERETDKNNAERHATIRNSSPNPARHTRKIFVTASADDQDQNPGAFGAEHMDRCARQRLNQSYQYSSPSSFSDGTTRSLMASACMATPAQ